MASKACPLEFPAGSLQRILHQLDLDETARLMAAVAGRLDKEQGYYSDCTYTLDTSSKRSNQKSNRWANIFAFDHSLLPGAYLNASLIPPYPFEDGGARRSYIASQAPLPSTLSTFYANLADRNVSLVVNLTGLVEHGRVKSDQYWPTDKGKEWRAGSYILNHRDEPALVSDPSPATLWQANVYKLRLTSAEEANQLQHDFELIHVTEWPDFGTFSNDAFQMLLNMIEERAEAKKGQDLWVHCSAGIGRSGTVIAAMLARDLKRNLPRALQTDAPTTLSQVEEVALLGAKQMVDHERRFRPKMVQTVGQFGMIATAIGEMLQQ